VLDVDQSNLAMFVDADDDVRLFSSTTLPILQMPLLGGHRSPRINVNIEGHKTAILLDTGAELSVLPKSFLSQIVSSPSEQPRNVVSFGGTELTLEGPRCLQVEICGVALYCSRFAL